MKKQNIIIILVFLICIINVSAFDFSDTLKLKRDFNIGVPNQNYYYNCEMDDDIRTCANSTITNSSNTFYLVYRGWGYDTGGGSETLGLVYNLDEVGGDYFHIQPLSDNDANKNTTNVFIYFFDNPVSLENAILTMKYKTSVSYSYIGNHHDSGIAFFDGYTLNNCNTFLYNKVSNFDNRILCDNDIEILNVSSTFKYDSIDLNFLNLTGGITGFAIYVQDTGNDVFDYGLEFANDYPLSITNLEYSGEANLSTSFNYNITYNNTICFNDSTGLAKGYIDLDMASNYPLYYSFDLSENVEEYLYKDFWSECFGIFGCSDMWYLNDTEFLSSCDYKETFLGIYMKSYNDVVIQSSDLYSPHDFQLFLNSEKCEDEAGFGEMILYGMFPDYSYVGNGLFTTEFQLNPTFNNDDNSTFTVMFNDGYNHYSGNFTLNYNTTHYQVIVNNSVVFTNELSDKDFYKLTAFIDFDTNTITWTFYDNEPIDLVLRSSVYEYEEKYSFNQSFLMYALDNVLYNYQVYDTSFGILSLKFDKVNPSTPDWVSYDLWNGTLYFNQIGNYNYNLYLKDSSITNYSSETININVVDSDICFSIGTINPKDENAIIENPATFSDYWTNLLYIVRFPYRLLKEFGILTVSLIALKLVLILVGVKFYFYMHTNNFTSPLRSTIISVLILSLFLWIMLLLENVWFFSIAIFSTLFIGGEFIANTQSGGN